MDSRKREVREPVEKFDIALAQASGVEVAHICAHGGEGCGEGGGAVRIHALIVAKNCCFAIRYLRAK